MDAFNFYSTKTVPLKLKVRVMVLKHLKKYFISLYRDKLNYILYKVSYYDNLNICYLYLILLKL